jgi:hypothetical protein
MLNQWLVATTCVPFVLVLGGGQWTAMAICHRICSPCPTGQVHTFLFAPATIHAAPPQIGRRLRRTRAAMRSLRSTFLRGTRMKFSCVARSTVITSDMQTGQYSTGSADERRCLTKWPNPLASANIRRPLCFPRLAEIRCSVASSELSFPATGCDGNVETCHGIVNIQSVRF